MEMDLALIFWSQTPITDTDDDCGIHYVGNVYHCLSMRFDECPSSNIYNEIFINVKSI